MHYEVEDVDGTSASLVAIIAKSGWSTNTCLVDESGS